MRDMAGGFDTNCGVGHGVDRLAGLLVGYEGLCSWSFNLLVAPLHDGQQ